MAGGKLAVLGRDDWWNKDNGKPSFDFADRDGFIARASTVLEEIQTNLFTEARDRRDANITRGVTSMDEVAAFFSSGEQFPGWVEVQWAKPTGDALEKVVETLKAHKLTIRNVPRDSEPADGTCIFTGEPAVERILIARAY